MLDRKEIKSVLFRYGLAVLAFAVTLLIAIALRSLSIRVDLSLLVIGAIMVTAWYGGRGPGVMVVALFVVISFITSQQPVTSLRFVVSLINVITLFGILVVLVTYRKGAEIRLREQREWLRVTLSSIGDAVIATDINGLINFMNPTAESLTGWTMSEAEGKPLDQVFRCISEETHEVIESPVSRVLKEGITIGPPNDTILEARDGAKIPIGSSWAPIRDAAGRITGAVLVLRNISERRQAEAEIRRLNAELERRVVERTEQLKAANKELESFSYSVSHDLRAPLRAIDGFSRILEESYNEVLDEEGKRLLGVVRRNTAKMSALIDDLLAFSRLGRARVENAEINMSLLARDVFEELRAGGSDRQIEFKINGLPPALGDRAMIRQVFANLLSNAIKFTRGKPAAVIELDGWAEGGQNVYRVKDNGVGFDMRYADKLFGVFQRLHGPEEFEGTGVGLALVQRIISRHGGRVWAEAMPNEGATFYFSLPAGEQKP